MSPRAWLLLLAAALTGVIVALSWTQDVREQPLMVSDLQLAGADAATFIAVCDQLASDRRAVLIDLPHSQHMLQFANTMSRRPSRLAATCDRAQVNLERFLAITVALGQARRTADRRAAWESRFEGRETEENVTAEIAMLHGREPQEASDPDGPPPWWDNLSQRERANYDVWQQVGERVTERWTDLMTRDAAGG